MNPLHFPWLEAALAVALAGSALISRIRDPNRAYRWCLGFTGVSLGCSVLAWLAFAAGEPDGPYSVQPALFGRRLLALDAVSAPLIPCVALMHFLAALSTARAHMRRFSFSWSLAAEALRLATFSCREPWVLIGLLAASTVPPCIELRNRGRSARLYVAHMALFVGLLVLGWWAVSWAGVPSSPPPWWATLPLVAAILVACGTVPAHCWVTDWFEHASLGIALLYVAPLGGVYAAIRLLLPIEPAWVLHSLGVLSLATAVYSSGMALTQRDARRFFAHLFLGHASLVLFGLELGTELSLTASLSLWISMLLSIGGFGLTLRSLEARFGRLSLRDHQGLYEHTPALAVCFLLTGLASVGFPGTLGFIATELLVDSAIEASPVAGVAVVAASAMSGIAVLRAYLLLFTGARHVSSITLGLRRREQTAVLTFAALILGGGLFPQPGVSSRQRAAEAVLATRPAARQHGQAQHKGTRMQGKRSGEKRGFTSL